MTTSYYLTTCGSKKLIEVHEIIRLARELYPGLSPTLSLIYYGVRDYEIYRSNVLGGSLSAVYSARKGRREGLRKDLFWLSVSLLNSGGVVGFLRRDEDAPWPECSTMEEETKTLFEILESPMKKELSWWELDMGRIVFCYDNVEVTLFRPIQKNNKVVADGYVARLRVPAKSISEAEGVLRSFLANEGAWTGRLHVPWTCGVAETGNCDQSNKRFTLGGRVVDGSSEDFERLSMVTA